MISSEAAPKSSAKTQKLAASPDDTAVSSFPRRGRSLILLAAVALLGYTDRDMSALRHSFVAARLALVGLAVASRASAQDQIVHVDLAYRAPVTGQPAPNFSPQGTKVELTSVPTNVALPPGAVRPAKQGMIKVGPDQHAWIPVLATATAEHPSDLCQLFLDRNRDGRFDNDGPPLTAVPTQNAKTKAWWSSMSKVELSVPYGATKGIEPYLVNFWIVRDDSAPAPDVLRYSVGSWRSGTTTVNGVAALVAAMDANNDALFGSGDMWSVLPAAAPDAAKAVLSITEARPTNRFMFLPKASAAPDGAGGSGASGPAQEQVLEFRSFSPDGRSIDFAVVDRPITKASDRAPDDLLKDERSRPRATVPFVWRHNLTLELSEAKSAGRGVLIDFETSWCGPCHSMDQWIWTDAEVAGRLNQGYIGVQLDGDVEKALVKQFKVVGYPTIIWLDSEGKEVHRVVGYMSSKEVLAYLNGKH